MIIIGGLGKKTNEIITALVVSHNKDLLKTTYESLEVSFKDEANN